MTIDWGVQVDEEDSPKEDHVVFLEAEEEAFLEVDLAETNVAGPYPFEDSLMPSGNSNPRRMTSTKLRYLNSTHHVMPRC
jgi:hypothetical protein